MVWNKASRTAGLICVLLLTATADNSVHILSKYGQLVTSSTLNWIPQAQVESYKADLVIGGFNVSRITDGDPASNQAEQPLVHEKPVFVCRAFHNGVWVSGGLISGEKRCVVSLLGVVHSHDRCELLVNVDNGARLSWVEWNKYVLPPIGVVASDKTYVARHKVHEDSNPTQKTVGLTHYVGNYDPTDKLGSITYVKDDGTEASTYSGEVLVETEPIYYDLTSVKLTQGKERLIKRTPMKLGEAVLSNTGSEAAKVAEGFGYSYNYSIYWGQGHAILKGLNTSVVLANGTRLPDIVWGIEEKEKRENVYTVEIFLDPGTAVNVTLRANHSDIEVPYTGKLVSHYNDGTSKIRTITGNRREENMVDVRPEFGPIYFLNNNTLVPTTVPPSTTILPTTKLPPISKETQTEQDRPDPDENMIIPPKKSDTSNMQRDDGGPLSLKNKVDGTPSGVCPLSITPSLILVTFLIVTFNRIT